MAVINLQAKDRKADVVLIGAGIMSATLGIILKKLDPDLHIDIYEKLDEAAKRKYRFLE